MPPRKKNSSEDELNKFKEEIEKKSRTHINRLLQMIEENRKTSEKKIDELNELKSQIIVSKNQNNVTVRHIIEENQQSSNIEVSKPLFFW